MQIERGQLISDATQPSAPIAGDSEYRQQRASTGRWKRPACQPAQEPVAYRQGVGSEPQADSIPRPVAVCDDNRTTHVLTTFARTFSFPPPDWCGTVSMNKFSER